MSFSTLRKYNVQHGMSPSVSPSKGSGSAPSGGGVSTPADSGNGENDAAALAGMGTVGAGLLGKFAYDKSKEELLNNPGANTNDVMGALVYANPEQQIPEAPGVGSTIANVPGMLGRSIGKIVPDSWANFMDKNNWKPLTGMFG